MRVELERPGMRHERQFLRAVRRSRSLHRGFFSPPGTAEAYGHYLRRARRKNHDAFLVLLRESRDLAGVIDVGNIMWGNLQSAQLSYCAFAPHAGSGLMREGMRLVINHCFHELKLHRLEVNIQPANARSISLIHGLGFRREGLSLRFLKIGGRWRDHERWALLAEEWRPSETR